MDGSDPGRSPYDIRIRELREAIMETERERPRACPYCEVRAVVRHGKTSKGSARYRCRACGKTFTPRGVISGSRLSADTWMAFADCMAHGYPVRRSADVCGVSVATAYRMKRRLDALMEERRAIRNTAPTRGPWGSARAY